MKPHSEDLPGKFPISQYSQDTERVYEDHLKAIQRENYQLISAQQAFRADLKELKEVRSEFRELIKSAKGIQANLGSANSRSSCPASPACASLPSHSPSHHPQLCAQEEEERPEPDEDLRSCFAEIQLKQTESTTEVPLEFPDHPPVPPPSYLTYPDLPSPQLPSAKPAHPTYRVPAPTRPWGYTPSPDPNPVQARTPVYVPPPMSERVYRGPQPTIPKFIHSDPTEFARLRIALENLLPPDGTELFKYQILVDHLKLDEARLIADAFLNSLTPYTDTMAALHEKFGQPHQLALNSSAPMPPVPGAAAV